jgi:signal transduction histidine kinase
VKLTLRARLVWYLTAQTLIAMAFLGVFLLFFNLHEQRVHPKEIEEEREEFYILLGLVAAVLPFVIPVAWTISGRVLAPLKAMARAAEAIRRGNLDQRLDEPPTEDEVGSLARTLNGAFDSYRQTLSRLDRFSFDAAHQLRNPLAAMRTAAEIALEKRRTPAEYENVLGQTVEQCTRLGHTVDQLLMLARLGRGGIEAQFEHVDVRKVLQRVLDAMAPAFEIKEITLTTDLGDAAIMVNGVPALLEEAIANLLDNAARFTPDQGSVRVRLSLEQGSRRAEISVEDSGPGIPEEVKGTLFSRWARGSRHPSESTGLGLAIAVDVARLHGGDIAASSSDSGGARLAIRLPATPLPESDVSA